MLRGSDLVVLGLGENAELPELLVQILHVGGDAGFDGTEVVILQLLTLGRLGAEERSAAELEVNTLLIQLLVDQKILLFGSHGGGDSRHVGLAEQVQDPDRLSAQALHRAEQRCLFVEHLAGVGAECGGNI